MITAIFSPFDSQIPVWSVKAQMIVGLEASTFSEGICSIQ